MFVKLNVTIKISSRASSYYSCCRLGVTCAGTFRWITSHFSAEISQNLVRINQKIFFLFWIVPAGAISSYYCLVLAGFCSSKFWSNFELKYFPSQYSALQWVRPSAYRREEIVVSSKLVVFVRRGRQVPASWRRRKYPLGRQESILSYWSYRRVSTDRRV